ncbi:MAG TPA: sugar ABC transporter substrate-binding protein [Thermoleophilaceae bacterium]|jgi:D-xylose transport system substrate-binding protein|nr:sugar ABC transporter substrate-binding protein [Thermoleophilaceae bacterium]
MKKFGLSVVCLVAAALLLAACGSSNNSSSSTSGSSSGASSSSGKGGKIAFLLPESKTARYETQDRPLFEQKVKALCSSCSIVYSNADQDASKQQQQAEAALTQGVKVMVLDPVDGAAAAAIVNQANAKKVPVISYDRLLLNSKPDYYIEFNSPAVGKAQGTALIDKLKKDGKKGNIIMINGAPTDNNAKLFKQGAHSVIDSSGFKVAKEYDTPDWSPDKAQSEMEQAITAVGKGNFVGVYAANDGTAGGAIAAMKSAGIDPKTIPSTGQDAEVAGIQRILAGDQYMTVYKPIKPLADQAATWAVDLANGKKPSGASATENNGKVNVPTLKLPVTPVTADKVKSTVIKDGYWKPSQICTGAYKSACAKFGIQ